MRKGQRGTFDLQGQPIYAGQIADDEATIRKLELELDHSAENEEAAKEAAAEAAALKLRQAMVGQTVVVH
jgi:hypothetical protein